MLKKINTEVIHPSWQPIVAKSLAQLDPSYMDWLETHADQWLPGADQLFNAFSLPLNKTHYVLFGESPYPRAASANGYAFWDEKVSAIWSPNGLSKEVNRATSLRNFIKMLLVADNRLTNDTSQLAITNVDKSQYITTINEFFNNFLSHGFLLLNASLVLSKGSKIKDANAWRPFMQALLTELTIKKPELQLILLGKIAHDINKMGGTKFNQLVAEHPYNLTFISNRNIIEFFRPFRLLWKTK